jgi:hypothetical protein
MASERESSQRVEDEEEEEIYDRPRPRRRFRGLHWRHASQSHTPPPPSQSTPQHSPPQLRPLSVNMAQSSFEGFNMGGSPGNSNIAIAATSPETPPSGGSYS